MKKLFSAILFCLISTFAFSADIYCVLNDDNVRVRTLPSTGELSKVITKVSKNQKLKVIAFLDKNVRLDNSWDKWYKIWLDESKGQFGWIFGKYLDIADKDSVDCLREEQEFFDEILNYNLAAATPFHAMPTQESVAAFTKGKTPVRNDKVYMKNYDDEAHPIEIDHFVYAFDGGEHKVRGGYWVSTKITKTVPNAFGVKIGMTLSELKACFERELNHSEYYENLYSFSCVYDVFSDIYFRFENGKLKEIEIQTDGVGN